MLPPSDAAAGGVCLTADGAARPKSSPNLSCRVTFLTDVKFLSLIVINFTNKSTLGTDVRRYYNSENDFNLPESDRDHPGQLACSESGVCAEVNIPGQ